MNIWPQLTLLGGGGSLHQQRLSRALGTICRHHFIEFIPPTLSDDQLQTYLFAQPFRFFGSYFRLHFVRRPCCARALTSPKPFFTDGGLIEPPPPWICHWPVEKRILEGGAGGEMLGDLNPRPTRRRDDDIPHALGARWQKDQTFRGQFRIGIRRRLSRQRASFVLHEKKPGKRKYIHLYSPQG